MSNTPIYKTPDGTSPVYKNPQGRAYDKSMQSRSKAIDRRLRREQNAVSE